MGSNTEENKENTQTKSVKEEEGETPAPMEITIIKEETEKKVQQTQNPPWALLVPVIAGENIKIRGDEFTVGRSNRCTLKVNDKHVSSVHFKITREQIGPGGSKVASIIDLSSNGTFLNSKKVIFNNIIFLNIFFFFPFNFLKKINGCCTFLKKIILNFF